MTFVASACSSGRGGDQGWSGQLRHARLGTWLGDSAITYVSWSASVPARESGLSAALTDMLSHHAAEPLRPVGTPHCRQVRTRSRREPAQPWLSASKAFVAGRNHGRGNEHMPHKAGGRERGGLPTAGGG